MTTLQQPAGPAPEPEASTNRSGTSWAPKGERNWQPPLQPSSDSAGAEAAAIARAEMLRRSSRNPEYFAIDSGLVQTWDKADPANPYKCLPQDEPYLRYFLRWLTNQQKIGIPKCRDMIATLTVCMYLLNRAMFGDGKEVLCLSDKSEKSEHNLGRILFTYDRMPAPVKAMIPMRYTKGTSGDPRIMRFLPRPPLWPGGPEFLGSKIEAIAQGAEQVQEYHPSILFWDQVETTRRARETYDAIIPVVKEPIFEAAMAQDKAARNAAGEIVSDTWVQFIIMGVAAPGFWKQIVFDQLDLA